MASMILFGHACPSRLIQSPWQAKDNAPSLDQKSENLDQTSVSPSWTIYKDLNNIKFIKKALNMSPVYSSIPYQGLIFISYDATKTTKFPHDQDQDTGDLFYTFQNDCHLGSLQRAPKIGVDLMITSE